MDILVRDVLLANSPVVAQKPPLAVQEWIDEDGIPVLHTGHPLAPEVVEEILNQTRREREFAWLG